MENYIIYNGELYHHGVKGMKWGVRRYQNQDGTLTKAGKYARRNLRGHAGPGINIGSVDRRLAKAKNDLEYLKKGGHLSVGTTKERQAQYDKRDREALEKTISKLEAKKQEKAKSKTDPVKDMSDEELRKKLNRLQMENQYKNLTKKKESSGRKFVTGVLTASATAVATAYATKYMKAGVEAVGKAVVKSIKS